MNDVENLFENLTLMNEVRKEDDYYQGAFWIIGDNMNEILNNHFSFVLS